MLVFVDESGDAGMKLGQGSSDFSIVTAILFDDHESADKCDKAIEILRQSMRWHRHREFHFTSNTDKIRKAFLATVVKHDFLYLSFALNKRLVNSEGFRVKESLIKYVSRMVFENAKPHLEDATVIFDGSGAKEFRQEFATYLRKRINVVGGVRHIKKVKMGDSRTNNLIQLADMICGAVGKSITSGNSLYRRIVKAREFRIQVWPTK